MLEALDIILASLTYETFANSWSRKIPLNPHEKSKINILESIKSITRKEKRNKKTNANEY